VILRGKTLLRLVCALALLCASCAALDRNAFTFTSYDLEIRLSPDSNGFDARGKIVLRNASDQPQRAIALQISSSLSWRSVRLADKPLVLTTSQYTSDVDHTGALSEATVTLAHDIAPKGMVELEISYGGVIPQNGYRLTRVGAPENVANSTEWDRISPAFTAFRGFGYVVWYPVSTDAASLSEGNRLATTIGDWQARETNSRLVARVQCLCEQGLASNGRLLASSPEEHKADIEFPALGSTVPVIALGDYHKLEKPEAVAYYLPEERAKAEEFAVAAQQATRLVSDWIGAPHTPALLIDVPGAAPFDTGSAWVVPLSSVSTSIMPVTATVLLARAAVTSPRQWIADGLPQFLRAVYDEEHGGRELALTYLNNFRAPLAEAEKQPEQNEPLVRSTDPIFYRYKAMYVWWMLRDMLGADVLKKAIRAYRVQDDKEPAYFQRLLRQFSTRDLEWFFDDWVYRDYGLPDFRIDAVFSRPLLTATGKVEGESLTITVQNLGAAGAEVPFAIRSASGEVWHRIEVRAKAKAVTRIQLPEPPEHITLNDGSVPESELGNNAYQIKASGK
jgi:hypothetical protein